MKNDVPSEQELRKVFCDITDGYCDAVYRKEDLVIKHLGQKDQYALERNKQQIYDKAKESGLPTEKEALKTLIENDVWSQEEEDKIEEQQSYLNNLQDTKKNLIIPSQIENINGDIKSAEKILNELTEKRRSLLTQTCEGYSTIKNNDFSIYLCLYKDHACEKKFFSWEEFGELSKPELTELLSIYTETTDHLNLTNIKYLAISDIFSLYYNICGSDGLDKFFNKPVYTLSFYQLNLLNYARVLHSILENVEGIPENIKKDPDDLLAYAESKSKNKNVVEKSKDKQGFSVMGATQKDMDEMGVSDELSISPFEMAKKKGSLTLEDFQDFS